MSSRAPRFPQLGLLGVLSMMIGLVLLGGCQSDEERLEGFLARGKEYIENDQHEEAIIEYKNVLQIDPENVEAHQALSLAYLEVEKPREAYWEMSETVRLDPENVDARLRYATVSAAIGDFELAEEQAEAVLALDSKNPAALVLRAQAREVREEFQAAESDFRAAVDSAPDAPAYRYLLSAFLERRGRIDDAEQELRDLLDVEKSFFATISLARVLIRERDPEREAETLAVLEQAVELAREAPTEQPKSAKRSPGGTTSLKSRVLREQAVQSAYLLLSAFHYDQGRFEKSIEVLEEGVDASESKTELIYQMARLYRLNGMPEQERALIERATKESPDNVSAQLVLSSYLGQQGDVDGALAAARAARAIDPDDRAALLREAELLVDVGYRKGDPESVQAGRAIVDQVLDEAPDLPGALFVRAKIEIAEDDFEGAKESLQAVLQAQPDWAQARFVFGSVLVATNELSRARVEVARAVELDPQLMAARKMLVKLHSQLGEHEFAIEQGRAYLAKQPDDHEVRIIVGQSLIRVGRGAEAYDEVSKIPEEDRDAAALFALGRLDLAFGRKELGTARLRRADELVPGNPQVIRTLVAIDRADGNLDASAARVAEAIAAKPESSELREIDADVKRLRGDIAGARAALSKAIELDPRNATAQISLADLESKSGNAEAAIGVMEKAAAAVPESADLQFRLALLYEHNDRREDAMDAYERAISLNSDLAMAKNNLAYLLTETGGDLDRALELAQQAKEQLPDTGGAADTLGWVLVKRGVPSAAIGYLEEAAERFPADAFEVQGIVRNHLAEAYELNKESDKAVRESRKVLENFQQLAESARAQGSEIAEPAWLLDARARIERLKDAS